MKPTSRILSSLLLLAVACAAAVPTATAVQPLTLARNGATDHVIAVAEYATPVDRYAADQLALYLGEMTGTRFAVIDGAELAADAPAIFVGLSAPALMRLGETDPLVSLGTQEVVYRSHDGDVYFYGDGVHGSLRAVMAFL